MNMDFGTYKTPIEVIKEWAFRGTYFRDFYSSANGKWYKKSWKEFDELKSADKKYYCSNYYGVSINKYGVKCRTSLRFCENKGWINSMDPYGWFQWYFRYWLSRSSYENKRQIARWNGIVSRFKGKSVQVIKDVNGRFDNYSILPVMKQVLLHWD